VFRVGAAYLAVTWLVLQILDVVRDILVLPDWLGRYTLFALLIGFPFALILAWAYELTPEGVKATDDVEVAQKSVPFGRLKIDLVIMGALSLVIVLTQSSVLFPPVSSQFEIVTDGLRIYFNDWESGRMGLRQMSVNGGETSEIPAVFDDRTDAALYSMTTDKDYLLLNARDRGQTSFWLWPVVGGDVRKLRDGAYGTYSPDGRLLFYTDGHKDMYLADTDFTESNLLGTAPDGIHWPRFSPDGGRVRFNVEGQYRSIWEVAVDGTNLRPVLPEWESTNHCCGSWTPDGNYFIFQATRDSRTQLWAIRDEDVSPDTQPTPFQITTGALEFRRPTLSADGTRIFAFSWQQRGELLRYNRELERFLPIPELEGLSATGLSYSKDEKWLAYVSFPERTLWRSRSDGSQRLQLAEQPMQVANLQWSPDAKTLAFMGRLPGQKFNIYMVSVQGGTPRRVLPEDLVHQLNISWSPDGASLVFSQVGKDHIQVLDVATGTVADLKGSEGLWAPRWSPDGRYLAVFSKGSLNLFEIKTGNLNTLVEDVEQGNYRWANDSQFIYLIDHFNRGAERSLYRVSIENKAVEKVAQIGEVRAAWGGFGPWVSVTPDGAVLMLRDNSIHHIYALDWLPE